MLIAVVAVVINTYILSSLINQYFKSYITETYNKHLSQIEIYAKKALLEDTISLKQMSIELETHLNDPIIRIKLYDANNDLIVDVNDNYNMNNDSIMSRMMNSKIDEIDHINLNENGVLIGQLNITRYSSIENSLASYMFRSSLITNSLFSIFFVLIIALIMGLYVSKKMSQALMNTASMAQDIIMGIDTNQYKTNINEINVIQQSLRSLNNRLKLKQKNRKALVDELIHQARTPLTILKTHLEGFADEIIKLTPEEIKVCDNQIENINAIISNMGNMIDAEKDNDSLVITTFEFNTLINQIINGLKAQFDKKNIKFKLINEEKVVLLTDKYKLSQIIYNILTNAYKYTKENGFVKISYYTKGEFLLITISDNGIGINKKDIDKIFNAYYRTDSSLDIKGEGIGLYIVKENINNLKGTIQVISTINEGSSFIISIPQKYDK